MKAKLGIVILSAACAVANATLPDARVEDRATEQVEKEASEVATAVMCSKPVRVFSSCDFSTAPLMELPKKDGHTDYHFEKESSQIKGIEVGPNCLTSVFPTSHVGKDGKSASYANQHGNGALLIKGPKRVCVGKALPQVKAVTIEDSTDTSKIIKVMENKQAEAQSAMNSLSTNLKIKIALMKGEVEAQKERINGVGPKGHRGARGDTGGAGETGTAGVGGMTGTVGQQGATGTVGATGVTGEEGKLTLGTQGPQGLRGAQGAHGGRGATGGKGGKGSKGRKGLEPRGKKGGRGAKGCAKLGSKNCDPLGRLMDGKRMGPKAVEHFHKIKADIHKELHGN